MEHRETQVAWLAGGCFWCLEAAYELMPGVLDVSSGYMGGETENPDYESVCSGMTGHAETVRIEYDPRMMGYEELLALFWKIHDPTTMDRQGADVGSQYRSVIFWADEEQKRIAEDSLHELQGRLADPVVTRLLPAQKFWPAEDYHQDFFKKHPFHGYCRAVIVPKLRKVGF
jgi:peptide-methionine (S)-S-oxide reductase